MRNVALDIASGDIISYLDTDDVLGKNHLAGILSQVKSQTLDWAYFNDYLNTDAGLITKKVELKKDSIRRKVVLGSIFNIGTLRTVESEFENNQDKINSTLTEIANSSQGINIGLNPYFEVFKKNNGFTMTINALAAAKINAFKTDTDELKYLLQGRFSLGTDLTIGESYPLTFSFAPVYTVFNSNDYLNIFGEEKSNLLSFDSSIIIPIGKGVGGVIDFNFGNDIDFAWGFGIIFAVQ
jgi:hypothetical protein